MVKGEAYLYNRDYTEAEREFDTAILLKTKMNKKVAKIYLDAGMEVVENNLSKAKDFFRTAIDKNPKLGKNISQMFIDKAFAKIEISPEIREEMFRILALAVEFSNPQEVETQKEMISEMLFEESVKRKEKGFIESSAVLAYQALEFNPFLQTQVIPHLLELGYQAIDKGKAALGFDILDGAKTVDSSIENDEKFYTYYHFKALKNPGQLDIKKAEDFMLKFKESPFVEDVLFHIIKYYGYKLDYEKAEFYIAEINSDYPNGKYQSEINKIQKEMQEVGAK